MLQLSLEMSRISTTQPETSTEKDVLPKTHANVFVISSPPQNDQFISNFELNEVRNEFNMTLNLGVQHGI